MSNTIKIGTNNINAIKLGSVDVDAVYLGTNLVYTSTPPTPPSKKLQLTYSDSSTYDIDCDTTTTLRQSDVSGGTNPISAITSAEIGDCVTSIGDSAFINCSGLTSIEIPNGVTSIGGSAFYGCTSLTSIDIPSGVTSIGTQTFYGCSSLSSIDIPSGVTSIGDWAFQYCSGLTSIDIPSGVTSIGGWAFQYCSSLTSITIPNSVTSIGYQAFMYSGLISINIPNSVTSISNYTFYGCRSLTSVTIGSGVTSIGEQAFRNCVSLTSITIPSGVTSIGIYAFQNCSGLTAITIEATTPPTLGNSALNDTNNCPIYVPCESVEDYKIASGWSDYASRIDCVQPTPTFDGKFKATYSDTTTYSAACDSSSALTTSDTRAHTTAYSAMTSAEIGDCVTSIGDAAFRDCKSLTSIDIPNSVTSIGSGMCSGCTSLVTCTIGSGVTSISNSAFRVCSSLTSIDIPNGVTSIGNQAFYNCSGLTSIDIPNGVTSIGNQAFYNCSGLTSIEIPSGVTSIGVGAFRGCSSLTSITIPNYVTSIGSDAFDRCSSLTSIDIPSGVTSIGDMTFYGCSRLTSIEIPSGVTSISDLAFDGCSGLQNITINALTPPSLGENVFTNTNNCPIYVPCESVGAYIAASGWSEYSDRIMTLSPSFFYRWVETQDTVCENGDLCAVEQYEWTCDGENYSASTLTRAGRVIESGSSQCAQAATILDAYELVSLSGNGTTSKTYTDGGVDFSSTQNWKLTGTTQGGSTASRISGKTDCTIALSSGGDIDNIVFICHNTSTKDKFKMNLTQGSPTITDGTTTLDGTTRYYVRAEFSTAQSSVTVSGLGSGMQLNMIGVNVPQGWETSLDDNS